MFDDADDDAGVEPAAEPAEDRFAAQRADVEAIMAAAAAEPLEDPDPHSELFTPAKTWVGAQPGYVFMTGAHGTGYYKDGGPPRSIARQPKPSPDETAAAMLKPKAALGRTAETAGFRHREGEVSRVQFAETTAELPAELPEIQSAADFPTLGAPKNKTPSWPKAAPAPGPAEPVPAGGASAAAAAGGGGGAAPAPVTAGRAAPAATGGWNSTLTKKTPPVLAAADPNNPFPARPGDSPSAVLVVDSAGFIKNSPLEKLGGEIVTIREVVTELRDKDTRDRIFHGVLPYELTYREPTAESVKAVSDFARLTGDFAGLSAVDIKVVPPPHLAVWDRFF